MTEATGDLYVTLDEHSPRRALYHEAGFALNRREIKYVISTIAAREALAGWDVPSEYDVMHADDVERDRLRLLDDALRQDVPGTDGWRWEPDAFVEETFGSPAFHPATYLVATERRTGEYVAIVRVWNNPTGSRLGFVGVLRGHRRRGVARGLLARALAALAGRGVTTVSTEVDDTNVASATLIEALGARPVGASVELVWRVVARRGP